jgi:hypothetical protein
VVFFLPEIISAFQFHRINSSGGFLFSLKLSGDFDIYLTILKGRLIKMKKTNHQTPIMKKLLHEGNGCILFNVALAQNIGMKPTLVYGAMVRKHYLLERNGLLDNKPRGEFFYTENDMEKDTKLSGHQQRPAIQVLLDFGLIRKYRKGYLGIRHFTITTDLSVLERAMYCSIEQIKSLRNREKPEGELF